MFDRCFAQRQFLEVIAIVASVSNTDVSLFSFDPWPSTTRQQHCEWRFHASESWYVANRPLRFRGPRDVACCCAPREGKHVEIWDGRKFLPFTFFSHLPLFLSFICLSLPFHPMFHLYALSQLRRPIDTNREDVIRLLQAAIGYLVRSGRMWIDRGSIIVT